MSHGRKPKPPCMGCAHEAENKLKHQPCIACEARIEYANTITGPIAEPSEFRNPNGQKPDQGEEIEAPVPQGMRQCIECGKIMTPDEFKRPGKGPHFKKCQACRQDKKPCNVAMDAAPVVPASKPAKVNGSAVPEGFIRYANWGDPGQEFITVLKKAIVISAGVVRKLGEPNRVDVYFNHDTRRIGILANKNGDVNQSMKMSIKRGTGTVNCSRLISENRIKLARRVPVEWHGEFVMTKEGVKTE